MRLIKPSFEILDQQCGLEGVYKQIEIAGRTCYKSEDKITEDSAKGFVDRMIKSSHGAMLEHGTVYLKASIIYLTDDGDKVEYYPLMHYLHNKYSKYFRYEGIEYVTTNYRVLVENDWLNDLLYICEPTEFHEKRVTVRFICDRGVSHEFVRHRVFSFAQESTRYCNYSKDKFGNEVTYIMPYWIPYKEGQYEINEGEDSWGNYNGDYITWNKELVSEHSSYYKTLFHFIKALDQAEIQYFNLLNSGWTPQQARAVLPNALKTELVMTGFVSDWKHFFELRDAASAHPQAQELAHPLHEAFIQRGLIE